MGKLIILTYKEGLRERIFLGILFIFLLLMSLSFLLAKISAGEDIRVFKNAGLVGIELTGIFIILFFVIQHFYQQRYTKILDLLLVKFGRSRYLLARWFGYLLLLFTYLMFSYLLLWALSYLIYGEMDLRLWAGFYFSLLKLSIILSFAILFCCLFTFPLVSFLASLFIYVSSELSYSSFKYLSQHGTKLQKAIFAFLYRVLPNMDKLDIKSMLCYGNVPGLKFSLLAASYSLVYCALLLLIALSIFQRREYV